MEHLADQLWSGGAKGDDVAGVYTATVGDVSVGEAHEAVVLHNAVPPVRTPELLDHVYWDFHGVVDEIVFADRVHAVDWQAGIAVGACPGGHGRLEWIALLARQAMVAAGRVHIEAAVYQVIDVCFPGCELE